MKATHKTIAAYNRGQAKGDKAICDALKREIEKALPKAESKIWHGVPVWFLDGNPIVGYRKAKDGVHLLFWSGQTFKEKDLEPEGSFKAAEACFCCFEDINHTALRRWLGKAKRIQWDYKNIIKNKGLRRLK